MIKLQKQKKWKNIEEKKREKDKKKKKKMVGNGFFFFFFFFLLLFDKKSKMQLLPHANCFPECFPSKIHFPHA